MDASVKLLNTKTAAPDLGEGEAAVLMAGCEARVRHAADRLDAAVKGIRELRDRMQQIQHASGIDEAPPQQGRSDRH